MQSLFSPKSTPISLVLVGLATSVGVDAIHQVQATETQAVTIDFKAMVGDRPFQCGESYSGLGTQDSTVTPTDFRFYVSEIALIDADGNAVPLTLEQDGQWQYQNVALLDFENKEGPCANGTAQTRSRVVGTVPEGDYQGLQFTLGVPFDLNHEDATLAPSPLNLTSLWWNWQGGYKFVRIDLETPSTASKGIAENPERHGHQAPHHQSQVQGFPIHLGSTGCQVEAQSQKPSSCSHPNTSTFVFETFDVRENVVVADLAALVAQTNLQSNQPDTPIGCMSSPEDGDCSSILSNFGLPFNGEPSPGQTFFRTQ